MGQLRKETALKDQRSIKTEREKIQPSLSV